MAISTERSGNFLWAALLKFEASARGNQLPRRGRASLWSAQRRVEDWRDFIQHQHLYARVEADEVASSPSRRRPG